MSDWGPVEERVKTSFDWGNSSVADAWKIGTDLGNTVINKAVTAFTETKAYASDNLRAGAEWAKEKLVEKQTAMAQKATRELLKDKQQSDLIVSRVDRRDRFSSRVVRPCGNDATTHPDKRDGLYMGKDCPETQAERPAEGTKPAACQCTKDGKAFPRVLFSNGINNPAKSVCSTMHAISESRCVEVIGIFNATYADPSLKGPERTLADYKAVALESLMGSGKGFVSGGLVGAFSGAAKGALPEVALQMASRNGAAQDVIDCIKTINQSTAEAASSTLSDEIVASLAKEPPEATTIYLHSQGGLNGGAAIAQAKGKLIARTMKDLKKSGVDAKMAEEMAQQSVEARLRNLQVYSFGTLERGLPDGPTYNRFTNELDPIPKVIREAQESYAPNVLISEPIGSPAVTTFRYAPSFNAVDAHGMLESYLPWLDKHYPRKPCC